MVLSLKNVLKVGVMESPAVIPVPWPQPLKPIENRFPELLAASGSFQERLGASGIDSSC